MQLSQAAHLGALLLISGVSGAPMRENANGCTETKVVILGGGIAGITAAQALSEQSIDDFVILEYNADIGGRMCKAHFGQNADGDPYTVEFGANWIEGLNTDNGKHENPIWTLAKKHNLLTRPADYDSLSTFNGSGSADYSDAIERFEDALDKAEKASDNAPKEEHRSMRELLSKAGWQPEDANDKAAEWWGFNFEHAFPPEKVSEEGSIGNNKDPNYDYDKSQFVIDQQGFVSLLKKEAAEFLDENDPRLHLNTEVVSVKYDADGVVVTNRDGSCVNADYALCTFSLGVLQHNPDLFTPALPSWKRKGIAAFEMSTYTKIYMQFRPEDVFWNHDSQFHLYADSDTPGNYPMYQPLDLSYLHPNSSIIVATVIDEEARRVEGMDPKDVQGEVLARFAKMYPDVDPIPEPTAIAFPKWSQEPWSRGSYSDWPPGTDQKSHDNLRAKVGRLYFAGEHTSESYFGFVHGAYLEGQSAGSALAELLS